jgi:hypothetical protein
MDRQNEGKNMITKYSKRGTVTRTTSSGNWTMYSPFRGNMTRIVKSKAIRVIGLILGMTFSSYQADPFVFNPMIRVMIPPTKEMPR